VLTIDLTYGNPLAGTNVTYDGGAQATAAGDVVNVAGSSGADSVTFSNSAITIAGSALATTSTESYALDGVGGLDVVTDNASQALAFTADQKLASLSLGSGASATLLAGKHAIYTRSLSLASNAKLDLTDGSL